jgi:serine-type D-Ala-D-Ala carboxypeptidase/endopeptidase
MERTVQPTKDQLDRLVAPFLKKRDSGLGFAIGYASPTFPNAGEVYFAGNIGNQFGSALTLDGATPFEIASISKTFTSMLYALLIRASNSTQTVGDYSSPKGPLPISANLAAITLDQLMNYTSGLPQDNDDRGAELASPPFWPQPYSMSALMSFLNAHPPPVSSPGQNYTYSNLAFAIMSAIIASEGNNSNPRLEVFASKVRNYILKPLDLCATFFDETSLANLPLGYHYSDKASPVPVPPGHRLFPAIFGGAGMVATPNDMFKWLLFNMGITQVKHLTPLLPVLQRPSTSVTTNWGSQLGLGWFIDPATADWPGSIFKDGDLDGFSSYIAFLPSTKLGIVPSQAGAFVLVNGDDIKTEDSTDVAIALTNQVLWIMQNKTLVPGTKALYPRSV